MTNLRIIGDIRLVFKTCPGILLSKEDIDLIFTGKMFEVMQKYEKPKQKKKKVKPKKEKRAKFSDLTEE